MPPMPNAPPDGACRRRFCGARHCIDQRLDLVRGRFLDQKRQNDTDRLLGDLTVDAEFGDESPDEFVHVFACPLPH